MRQVFAVIVLVACGGDDSSSGGSCEEMQRAVTQTMAECRLAPEPTGGPSMCPLALGAYCSPDGLQASCPLGWAESCDGPDGQGYNCTYGAEGSCMTVNATTVSFDFTQTLNGRQGLIVFKLDGSGDCEFRACNPL